MHWAILLLAFVILLLLLRLSQVNDRMKQIEDYLLDCVTKHKLPEILRASLTQLQ
uniref:Uncharacterized protein n=1 Tax=viral metagenome TaxID=1070528 RepID=A0A6C0CL28_9ZZZZ